MKIFRNIFNGFLFLLLSSSLLYADEAPPRITELTNVFDRVLEYVFPVAGLICVIFVIIGGYMWMSSGGDPMKIKQAQGTLTWALIGLIFTLLSYAILRVIVAFVE